MRQLSKIRRIRNDLAFETKIRQRRGKKRWGVIVADRAKLTFDRRSLFYDRKGRRLHNYTTLGKGGEKIAPPPRAASQQPRSYGKPFGQKQISIMDEKCQPLKLAFGYQSETPVDERQAADSNQRRFNRSFLKNGGVCDPPIIREDSYGIQRSCLYGAKRDLARSHSEKREQHRAPRSLQRRAFALVEELAGEHWDNCKVTFSRRTAFCYALKALQDGHEATRILRCYGRALFVCHGLAVDCAARAGRIIFFNLSSTVVKARKLLASDGLIAQERISLWYQNHSHPPLTPALASEPIPFDTAELRRKIAESLGCDEPLQS